MNFNPPVPRGTGRCSGRCFEPLSVYFNPPVPRGTFQSTRPSRDGTAELSWADHEDAWISIHPSLAGRDRAEPVRFIPSVLFQSTRPSRDGTFRKRDQRKRSDHFNPPVPRGTGRKRFEASGCTETFQSTRPSRDGTPGSVQCPFDGEISIHPSLAGRDWQNWLRT